MQQTNLSTSSSSVPVAEFLRRSVVGQQPTPESVYDEKPGKGEFGRFMLKVFLPLVVALLVILFSFTYLFEQKVILASQICGAYKINRIISHADPNEIPMFGSSRAQGSFLPDSMGSGFFNYGMDEAGYNVMLMMLQEECKKQKESPLLVLNFDMEGMRSAIGDVANYLYNAEYPPVQKLLQEKYSSHYHIPVIKYYGQFEMYTKYYLNDKMKLTKYTNRGASIEKNVLPEKKFQDMVNDRRQHVTTFANEPSLEKGLFSIIHENPSRHFVFVVSPYHQSYFERYSNLPEAQQFLERLEALPNATVFDFSRHIYPDDHFMNTTHINYKGALVFNQALRDSLRAVAIQ